ncbi:MAG TPA: pseudomurein-binding repeat-containing protein, partial [Methanobacterium sp.]|nr:pseudomurein-binding repeat-containing protein [Methanobacterium sp.]
MLVLMLLALTLPLSANISFATTNTATNVSDQYSDHDKQVTSANSKNNTTVNNNKNLAAGSAATTTATNVSSVKKFTSTQINDAASRVKTYIETYNKLPSYVTISSVQVSMPQFLQLLTSNLININSGLTTSVTLKSVSSPSSPTQTLKSGNIYKSAYISL